MGMKWFLILLIPICTCSCIDFERSEHVDDINSNLKELEMSKTRLNKPVFDSISPVLSRINTLKERLHSQLSEDTLSLETALKIDEYKQIEASLIALKAQIPITQKDIQIVTKSLKNLKKDIEQNSGDRANYGKHLTLEQKNQEIILEAVDQYESKINKLLERFETIHDSLQEYSIQLEMKNKE